jgi:hypothetical protein
MTQIDRLLRQKPTLCLRAFEETRDLNEAHLLVHGVMVQALSNVGAAEQDLGSAMSRALGVRAQRLAGLETLV